MTSNYLAYDLGASNGRAFLGSFNGEKLSLSELSRFEHGPVKDNQTAYWNIELIKQNLFDTLRLCSSKKINLKSFGLDSWGVDYVLLDKEGKLVSKPQSYRNMTSQDMIPVHNIISEDNLFQVTGLVPNYLNTIYQLKKYKDLHPNLLEKAKSFLMLSAYFGYMFTGEKLDEYTSASTSMIYSIHDFDWAFSEIAKLDLPTDIFGRVAPSGTVAGNLSGELVTETGYNNLPYISVGTLDTGSAVAASIGGPDCAFCSSGTWSLIGIESEKPILTKFAFDNYFSNEGTVQGTFRPIQNITGMWIIQECRKQWIREGLNLSWNDITLAASMATPFKSIIDIDNELFFSIGDMVKRIQQFCRDSAQKVPETVGEIARCVYDSMALRYKRSFEQCSQLKGSELKGFNIVGGGTKNEFLNQLSANVIGHTVISGPEEAACIGNIIEQCIAIGEIKNLEEGRDIIRHSFDIKEFDPEPIEGVEEAFAKYVSLYSNDKGGIENEKTN